MNYSSKKEKCERRFEIKLKFRELKTYYKGFYIKKYARIRI